MSRHFGLIPRSVRREPIRSSWVTGDTRIALVSFGIFGFAMAFVLALFLLAVFAKYAHAQDNHDLHHTQYYEWKSNEGFPCCNNQDCGTLPESRMREIGGRTEVLVFDEIEGDEWCPVEERHLIDQTHGKRLSPDWNMNHACIVSAASGGVCAKLKCFMEKGKF